MTYMNICAHHQHPYPSTGPFLGPFSSHLFLTTMCEYVAQIMGLEDEWKICVQEVYYAPTSYLYLSVPEEPASTNTIYSRCNIYFEDLLAFTLGILRA